MKTKLFFILAIFVIANGVFAYAKENDVNGFITVTEPNKTSVLQKNDWHTISWNDNIDYNVQIDLYRYNDLLWTISYNTINDGNEEFYLNDSYETGGGYRIKITNKDDPSIYDWSDYFYVTKQYQNDYPCGANYLGIKDNISWNTISNLDLDDSGIDNPGFGYNSNGAYGDNWLYFTAPNTGMVDLLFEAKDGNPEDWAVAVYENTCDELVLFAIDDNSGDNLLPELHLTNLNPGSIYYVCVWENNCDELGEVRICGQIKYPPSLTILYPDTSAYTYSGGKLTIKWASQAIDYSDIIKITTIINGQTNYITCNNYHEYTITIPNTSTTDHDAVVAVSLLKNSQVYDFSEPFTVDATKKYDLVVSSFDINTDEIQQGAPSSIIAKIKNNGNLPYDGAIAIKLFDLNGNLISVLTSYTGVIDIGETITLSFLNQVIVADVGDFYLNLQYLDPDKKSIQTLENKQISINGLDVLGEYVLETSVNKNVNFASTIISPSKQTPPLLSILKITNNDTKDIKYVFLNNIDNQELTDGEKANFDLDYSFDKTGKYTLQYIGLYDWDNAKSKTKDTIKNGIKSESWYYSYGDNFGLNVYMPLEITDITKYPTHIYQYATSFTGENAFKIKIDNYDKNQPIKVEAIFTRNNSNTGPVSFDMINLYDNVWVLEKDSMYNIDYYTIQYKVTQGDFFNIKYKYFFCAGFVENIVNDGKVNTDDEFDFNIENFGIDIQKAQIRFFTPGHFIVVKDLTKNSDNKYSLDKTSLSLPGYYSYRYLITTTDGTELQSNAYRVFAGFENDCSKLAKPGMISRWQWCPNCYSENENNGIPTHIIIHHSVTTNFNDDYNVVKNIYDNHISIGDHDIAYHYLIGSDGRIYEGLQGGPDKKGYHFSSMNSHTIGICLLGTFHNGTIDDNYYNGITPTPEALKSLDLLLEWLCSEYQIDPIGTKDHYYPDKNPNKPDHINKDMPQVAPHNIVNNYGGATACPGNLFPNIVSSIAQNVFYCPARSSHQILELNSDISINNNAKSRTIMSDTINVSGSIIVLQDTANIRFRAVLYNKSDTLIIGETEYFKLLRNQEKKIEISNIIDVESGEEYLLKVEYNAENHEEWNMLLSDKFDNDFPVDVQEFVSIREKKEENTYTIYPNPSKGNIFVEYNENVNNGSIVVVNVLGDVIENKRIKNQRKIILKQLKPGIYFIHLVFDGKKSMEKVIVQ